MATQNVPRTRDTGGTLDQFDSRTNSTGALRQVVVPGQADGDVVGGFRPYSHQQVSLEPTSRFYDGFTTALDTTFTYTTAGTAPTQSGSTLTLPTAALASSSVRTQRVFKMHSTQHESASFSVQLETTAGTGSGRFWGLGVPATSQSTTVLAQDGVGFEVDAAAGALFAVTYRAGTRTQIAALARPSDGAYHRYSVMYRQTTTYWLIDGVTVATANYLDLAVVDFPLLLSRSNGATVLNSPVMVVNAMGLADHSRLATQLGDGDDPGQLAQVTREGGLRVAQMPSTLGVTATAAAGSAVTLTLPAAGPGLFHYVTSIRFVLYNAAARTAAAAPITVTTTNLPGSPVYMFPTLGTAGALDRVTESFGFALKSSAPNTATTFVAPAVTGGLWRLTALYYSGA